MAQLRAWEPLQAMFYTLRRPHPANAGPFPSSLSRVKCWIESSEFDAGVAGRELPVDGPARGVASRAPRRDRGFHRQLVGKPLSQALALPHTQRDLSPAQPTSMLRGLVNLQLVRQPFWPRLAQRPDRSRVGSGSRACLKRGWYG